MGFKEAATQTSIHTMVNYINGNPQKNLRPSDGSDQHGNEKRYFISGPPVQRSQKLSTIPTTI